MRRKLAFFVRLAPLVALLLAAGAGGKWGR
jgi:hypothetical protein